MLEFSGFFRLQIKILCILQGEEFGKLLQKQRPLDHIDIIRRLFA